MKKEKDLTEKEMVNKLIEHLQGFIQLESSLGNTGDSLMGRHIKSSEELINKILCQRLQTN